VPTVLPPLITADNKEENIIKKEMAILNIKTYGRK
jgi:hypothetical protein